MRVVLREAAHAHQPVQGAGQLVPVHKAQFADALRQVLVRMQPALVDEHAARAVHGLDGVVGVVYFRDIHIVLVVVPVPRPVPQVLVEDHGRFDLLVSARHVLFAPVIDKQVVQEHAFRQEEGEARALLVDVEQVQLAAELAVIALFGLLEHVQVLLKHGRFGETGAVDALEHLVLAVAVPVGAGGVEQLDRLDRASGGEVRAGAQVGELALFIE